MFLVQSSFPILAFIIDPIAKLMGIILNLIFEGLSAVGIVNMGLCIIIFTIVIKLLMLPMTIKQTKFSKMSQLVQPEITKIQKKYQNKTDNASMMKQQEEIQAVYDKYGISMSGGCLQMFIQLPILMALFQVIRNLPFYIPRLKELYTQIAEPLMQQKGFEEVIVTIGEKAQAVYKLAENPALDNVIAYISQFRTGSWAALTEAFPSITEAVNGASAQIIEINNFFAGINIADAPGFRVSVYLIIPILAFLTQWLAMKTMNMGNDENNPANSMTKSMNMMMPIMSLVMCFSFPAGLGIYWIMTAVFQIFQQIIMNKYYETVDMDKLIAENMEKASKKKKKKTFTQKLMEKAGMDQPEEAAGSINNAAATRTKNYARNYDNSKADEISYSSANAPKAKPGSLAEKAGLVREYNERTKKGGKK